MAHILKSFRTLPRNVPSALSTRFVSKAEGGKPVSDFMGDVPDTSVEINSHSMARNAANGRADHLHDSTSALDYKLHTHNRPPPLPVFTRAQKSAEDHVLSILYNTPPPSTEPIKRHFLNCLVQDEPGVLSRVSGILAGRGFNIDSLVVCKTGVKDLSRMCIVLKGQDGVIEQARRQLEDLVPVWAVLDYTNTPVIQRELLLVKISTLGPEYFDSQLSAGPSFHPSSEVTPLPTQGGEETPAQSQEAYAHDTHAHNPTPAAHSMLNQSEALIRQSQHLAAIQALATQFGGKVVDVSSASAIIELSGKTERIEAFLGLVKPWGILEAARSGAMVMPRTPLPKEEGEEEFRDESVAMDASLLPPG
ncbi:acetolactate synthase [Phaffia rhodozyma]|uniref:Acetolactate synthase n=1 Tax=Phaffia rhodozyma TaxID=264483 RepID=A0A0F7SGD9_PHARH|nr:acetolactate synthase [Phaffia rhodozyma]